MKLLFFLGFKENLANRAVSLLLYIEEGASLSQSHLNSGNALHFYLGCN